MSAYGLALFLHVSGAIGAGVGVGIWLFDLAALRRARRVEQVRALAWLIIVVSPLMVLSVLLVAVAGLAMALGTRGVQTPWIAVATASFALMAPVGPLVLDARMRAVFANARVVPDGTIPDALGARARDPALGTAAQTLAAVLLGIVFLMTTKPLLGASVSVMVIALACGLLSGAPHRYAARRRAGGASAGAARVGEDPSLKTTFWTRRW